MPVNRLESLRTALNVRRVAAGEKELPNTKAVTDALLDKVIADALCEQDNAEINQIAAAYRLLDDTQKAAVRAAAGIVPMKKSA